MNFLRLSVLLLTLGFLSVACREQTATSDSLTAQLQGRWELEKAWRNGRQTETLAGIYYEFADGNVLTTNMTPSLQEESYVYEVKGQQIVEKTGHEVLYTITEFQDSVMSISLTIHDFPFRLLVRRTEWDALR
ncbi:MAG: hypothetical protein RLY31_577 [Bacteroidota bacterium]